MTAVLDRPVNEDPEEFGAATSYDEAELQVSGAGSCCPGSKSEELDGEAGMATAEYAIATIAAVGFGALLITILKSDMVRQLLEAIFQAALTGF